MKKTYKTPRLSNIQLRVEQQMLTGSVGQDNAPVPDALEGDTDPWGDWV